MSGAAEVSVYDRMCWPEGELERALAGGAHRRELSAYLGESEYAMLSALARQAQHAQTPGRAARRRPASKIYLLPGILGSQLGRARAAGEPVDLLWLDPDDIVRGRLSELADAHTLRPLGAVVYSYLALKLRLAAAGFTVALHDYDWRADLLAQGRALAARLEADAAEQLVLIGHSMGGLLARVALAQAQAHSAAARITRLIGLGAPHAGSFAAVQALRATYPVVCRLAAIDRVHDAELLTTAVFRSFVSLYQLLPTADARLDLFNPDTWPRTGARPDPVMLQRARGFERHLARTDARFVSILGSGQRTVTGAARHGSQFRYDVSSAGDGTVATASAWLPGVRNYCLRCEHSELPRHPLIAAALIDLSLHGRTRRLRESANVRPRHSIQVTDAMLRRSLGRKIDWAALSSDERRRYLNRLNEPPALYRPRAST